MFFIKRIFLLFLTTMMMTCAYASEKSKNILYITRLNVSDNLSSEQIEIRDNGLKSDQMVKSHLEKLGYKVTFSDQNDDNIVRSEHYDLVILSSVVQSRGMADTPLKNIKTPLLTWENDLFDSLRFTGKRKGEDYGEVSKEHYIRIINASHPMANGIVAGKTFVYPRDTSMGWGVPARAAIVIATLPGDMNKAVVFGYEKGATMDYDFIAPARRVALFLDNTTFSYLSPNGLKLFDASVAWAIDHR